MTGPAKSRHVPRGPDKSQQVPASPVSLARPRQKVPLTVLSTAPHVPTPILSNSVRSRRQSCQVPSGPDANSVKSCRDRSYKLVDAAHHHQSFLRGTWSCLFSTVTSQSRSPDLHCSVSPLWSLCCGIGDTGRPKKCRENAQTRNRGARTVCPLSVCQCVPCPSVIVPSVSQIIDCHCGQWRPTFHRQDGVSSKVPGQKNGNSFGIAT